MIGKKCCKKRIRNKNPKPFKSGLRFNTIKGLTINPNTNKPAYTFEEDDSVVNCDAVEVID